MGAMLYQYGYVTSASCTPSSLGCYLSCTVFPNLLKPLANLNSLNVQLNWVDSWAPVAAAMSNSTPSLGDYNLAGWKSCWCLIGSFFTTKHCVTQACLWPCWDRENKLQQETWKRHSRNCIMSIFCEASKTFSKVLPAGLHLYAKSSNQPSPKHSSPLV